MRDMQAAMDKLLSKYRHEFLNVLQVVGGLAQLNKTDRLLSYIRKASEEVQQMGRLIVCGDPRLALMVYESMMQDADINCLVHVSGTVNVVPEGVLSSLKKVLHVFQKQILSLPDCTVSVTIKGEQESVLRLKVLGVPNIDFWQPVLRELHYVSCGLDIENNELALFLDKPPVTGEK